MPFTAESAATIRDRALQNWRARYLARGEDLDITEGSDAYNELDALSLEFEGLGLGAQEAAHRVLLRYAAGQDLDDFAEDDGTARQPATTARRVIRVTGPANATTPTADATLATPGGLRFRPIDADTGATLTSIATDGDGVVDVVFECATAGVTGNLVTDTVLTWSSAPTGFNATAVTVTGAAARDAENAEGDDALRTRLLERRRERPGSGNRADWREKAREVAGVGDVFVHCCAWPPDTTAAPPRATITPNKLGCTTLLPVTPPPAADSYVQNADGTLGAGLDPSYSRRPSADLCTNIGRYLDGTHDANGVAVAEALQKQWYPGVIDRTNWNAVRAKPIPVGVTIEVMVEAGTSAWAFDGTRTVSSATSASQMVLSSVVNVAMNTLLAFHFADVDADGLPTVIRGGWALGKVATVNPSTHEITLVTPLPAAPSVGALVRADAVIQGASAWDAIRRVVFQYFDTLGPGAPTGLARSERFPPLFWGAPGSAIPSKILVAALTVPGVTDAAVPVPSATPFVAMGELAVPGVFAVHRKIA